MTRDHRSRYGPGLLVMAALLACALAYRTSRSPAEHEGVKQVILSVQEPVAADAMDSTRTISSESGARTAVDISDSTSVARSEIHYSVAGRVFTSEGQPAVDVETWIQLEVDIPDEQARETFQQAHGLESLSPRLRTDRSGSFRFDGLPSVRYSLYVADAVQGGLPRSELLDADTVLNITLQHRLGISGRVLGLQGKQGEVRVASCDTFLESVMGGETFRDFGDAGHEALTESDGSYAVEGLQPGWYEVLAHAEGLGTAIRRVELITELEQVDLELSRGLTFAGRVEADFPVDERRSRLSLSPRPVPHDLFDDGAGPDGSFRFDNLPAGTYQLTVWFRAAGKRRTDVERTFSVDVENDVTDFHRTVSIGTERVSVQVNGPVGDHFVDGVLTAKGRHGFHSSVVRINPGRTAGSHEAWRMRKKVFNPTASFSYARAFTLDLPPGEWEISLDLSGYRPWSERVLVTGALSLTAQPELLAGRAIAADLKAKDVRVEARLLPGGEWFKVLEHDYSYRPVLEITPHTSWLPEGRYDLRVSTRSTVEHLIEGVEVKASHSPLVVTSPEKEGLRISGRLLSNARSNADVSLYLYLKDGDRWRPLPRKTSQFGWAYPEEGTTFHFVGLRPGKYRASVDQAGQQIVSNWTLTTSDLLGEVVQHEFR